MDGAEAKYLDLPGLLVVLDAIREYVGKDIRVSSGGNGRVLGLNDTPVKTLDRLRQTVRMWIPFDGEEPEEIQLGWEELRLVFKFDANNELVGMGIVDEEGVDAADDLLLVDLSNGSLEFSSIHCEVRETSYAVGRGISVTGDEATVVDLGVFVIDAAGVDLDYISGLTQNNLDRIAAEALLSGKGKSEDWFSGLRDKITYDLQNVSRPGSGPDWGKLVRLGVGF